MTDPRAAGAVGTRAWLMALMGLLVLFVSNGFAATALSVYDESLLREFGWDRGPFKFRDLLNFGVTAAIAPFIGIVIDRVNPRWLLTVGMGLLSAGYFAYSQLQADGGGWASTALAIVALCGLAATLYVIFTSDAHPVFRGLGLLVVLATMAAVVNYGFLSKSALAEVYVIHVVFALALSTAGTMVVLVLISSWFLKYRGLAIGIALLGTSLGGIVLSPVNAWLIQNVGWRGGFGWLALLPIAAAVLILAVVRMPREAGAVALGQTSGTADLKNYGLTFSEALRTPTFWAIGISGFLTYYSILALFNHLFLHMRGLGFEPAVAARSLALLGLMAAISKLAIGWLADVIDRKKVFLGCLAVMFVGVLMLATTGRDYVWAAIFVIGSGWGGLFTLYNMLAVNNFGLREIGRINGAVSTLESLGGGVGIWLTGVLFDVYGKTYEIAFDVIAGCVLLGFVIGLTIRSGSPEAMGAPAAAAAGR